MSREDQPLDLDAQVRALRDLLRPLIPSNPWEFVGSDRNAQRWRCGWCGAAGRSDQRTPVQPPGALNGHDDDCRYLEARARLSQPEQGDALREGRQQ
jgi:hypothetical protein